MAMTYDYNTRKITRDWHIRRHDEKCRLSGLPAYIGGDRCQKCPYNKGTRDLEDTFFTLCSHPEAKDSENQGIYFGASMTSLSMKQLHICTTKRNRTMSKAEIFISDCTMNGSNQIINGNYGTIIPHFEPWLTPDDARKAVEIAREEMIEKMKFYIENMVSDITFSDIDGNDNYDLNKFIGDLKQAMNYE